MKTAPSVSRKRGSMLIVAMGILTLVTLLAVTFGLLMSLEKKVAAAYVDTVHARMLAQAGIESTIGWLKEEVSLKPFSDPASPLVFNPGQDHLPNFREDLEDVPVEKTSGNRVLGQTHGAQGENRFRVKVIDCNTMININDQYPTLHLVLEGLGRAIAYTQGGENPIPKLMGQRIVDLRDQDYGGKFKSKYQIAEAIGEEAYHRVRDYITTHSWKDHKAVMPSPDSIFNPSESIKRGKVQFVLPEDAVPGQAEVLGIGGRSPINVNQAPKEVLMAAIWPVGGRRAYHPIPNIPTPLPIDSGLPGGGLLGGSFTEELDFSRIYHKKLNYNQWRPYQWVYFVPYYLQPDGVESAAALADMIIRERVGRTTASGRVRGPFRSVADFDRWVDGIPNNSPALINAGEVEVPTDGRMAAWGPVQGHPGFRRFVTESARSIIKANFNPNALVNSFNPDSGAYRPVDKANLLFPKQDELRKIDLGGPGNPVGDFVQCQSTDFCFGSLGFYEITSLGEVVGEPQYEEGADADEDLVEERPLYGMAKMRTVVQVMGAIRHTSQMDFERNDNLFNTSSRRRMYVRSHPENDLFAIPGDGSGRGSSGTAWWASGEQGYVSLDTALSRPAGATPRRNIVAGGGSGSRAEPLFELTMDKRLPLSGEFQMLEGFLPVVSGGVPNSRSHLSEPWGTAIYGHHFTRTQGNIQASAVTFVEQGGNLLPDGFWSSLSNGGRGTTPNPPTLWYRAADQGGSRDPGQQGNSLEEGVVNVGMHEGTVEFWLKPDFDWSFWDQNNRAPIQPNPIFCGFFQSTHIMQNPDVDPSIPQNTALTRCKQMFLFRNTSGDIRLVRLYSELIGMENAQPAEMEQPWIKNPNIDDAMNKNEFLRVHEYIEENLAGTPGFEWPPRKLGLAVLGDDGKAYFARIDAIIPYDEMRYWRAREWHHMAISWDDRGGGGSSSDPNAFVRCFLDGRAIPLSPAVNARLYGSPDTLQGGAGEFVRLNHDPIIRGDSVDPAIARDSMFVGSIHRKQTTEGGVFKFGDEITFGSNATVDDFRVYRQGVGDGVGVARPADRYVPGVYEQRIEVPFPGNVKRLRLGTFQFTAYMPKEYNDSDPAKIGGARIEVTLAKDGNTMSAFGASGWRFDDTRLIGGFPITRDPNPLTERGKPVYLDRNQALSYRVHMRPARSALGNVGTPILDDVTLTYFLPKVKVLHQEEVLE